MSTKRRREKEEEISRAYYGDGPGALTSRKTFTRLHPEFEPADIRRFFLNNLTTIRFFVKTQKLKKYQQGNISHYFGHIVQADLAYFPPNKTPVLIVADVETKYLSARVLSDKRSRTVSRAFRSIYNRDYIPYLSLPYKRQTSVLVDRGGEFVSHFLTVCKKLHIDVFRLSGSISKANLAERLISLVKRREALLRLQTGRNRRKFFVKSVVKSYNSTPIKGLNWVTPDALRAREPAALEKYNARIRFNVSWEDRLKFFLKTIKKFAWLKRDSWVRITTVVRTLAAKQKRSRFGRLAVTPTNQLELFKVISVRWPSVENKSHYPYVALADALGKRIPGFFRIDEIIRLPSAAAARSDPTDPDYPGTLSYIEKVAGGYKLQIAGKQQLRYVDIILTVCLRSSVRGVGDQVVGGGKRLKLRSGRHYDQ